MRRDTGEEGGREFSSKMPRIMSNLPDFPRRPFLYVHLCVNTFFIICLRAQAGTIRDFYFRYATGTEHDFVGTL